MGNEKPTDRTENSFRRVLENIGTSAKHFLTRTFSITEDAASHEEIRDRLLSGGKITGTNMCVMVCAILIASVGTSVLLFAESP